MSLYRATCLSFPPTYVIWSSKDKMNNSSFGYSFILCLDCTNNRKTACLRPLILHQSINFPRQNKVTNLSLQPRFERIHFPNRKIGVLNLYWFCLADLKNKIRKQCLKGGCIFSLMFRPESGNEETVMTWNSLQSILAK